MEVKLDFLTPLWTADATGKAQHVEGTGLMGSLRWWYEVLIRGLGGWACDPSTDGRCLLDAKAFGKRLDQGCTHAGKGHLCPNCEAKALTDCGLCPACQVFGATGWARVFHLRVDGKTKWAYPLTAVRDMSREVASADSIRVIPDSGKGYFFPPGRLGSLTLTLVPRRPLADKSALPLMVGLLEFIRRNGALGSKTNLGYGLFQWAEQPGDIPSALEFVQLVAKRAAIGKKGDSDGLPDLREMFFANVALGREWQPKDFANFKRALRGAFCQRGAITNDADEQQRLRRFIFGTTEEEAQASKIKMALLPDRRTLRVWGWVPEEPYGHAQQVLQLVRNELQRYGNLTSWRKFDSRCDTKGRYTDAKEFLQSLMEG